MFDLLALLGMTLPPIEATWVSQSTTLWTMGDPSNERPHTVLTDPVFAERLFFGLARQHVEAPPFSDLPAPELVLLSHLHDDHFHPPSLRLAAQAGATTLVVPRGAGRYLPEDLGFAEIVELGPWEGRRVGELQVTAVPIRHLGGTWGVDALWNRSFTAYVVEHEAEVVLFVGDTGVAEDRFRAIAERFPHIDLAFLPIAPVKGPLLRFMHTGPREALEAWEILGEPRMIPIHYAGFWGRDQVAIDLYDQLASGQNRRTAPGEWLRVEPTPR